MTETFQTIKQANAFAKKIVRLYNVNVTYVGIGHGGYIVQYV